MHSAGRLNREQSLSAKALKPNAPKRRQLEQEWLPPFMLLIDELLLSPPVVTSRAIDINATDNQVSKASMHVCVVYARTQGHTHAIMGRHKHVFPPHACM